MKIAVITGASSGIGREFALRLDNEQSFDEMWVISRSESKLASLKDSIKAKLRVIPLDLTKPESITSYSDLLKQYSPTVSVLVNAGGFGKLGAFTDISLTDTLEMTDLNEKALVAMTYATLPYMQEGSQIYQMGSLSAFQPLPFMSVYAAGKAFVLSFSRALSRELKQRKIRVLAVCPSWVDTNFLNRAAKTDAISHFGKLTTADVVVTRALKDMKRGRDVSICTLRSRSLALLSKLMPHKLVMAIWCRQQKQR